MELPLKSESSGQRAEITDPGFEVLGARPREVLKWPSLI